ncbi:MAG: DNA polymerase III subunit alpha [Rickettsiales bacterium]|nr:DNA polymerase III subunit alpha [Rickettsiales bacterium]
MKSSTKFIHLRNYTQYSLSKGAIKISELIEFCITNGLPAVSITDFNNLFGCMEFSIECIKKGIQPIIGSNIYLKDINFSPGYVLLLCRNENGFKNLSKLISISSIENSNNTDVFVTFDNLKKFNEDLICLAGGQFGILSENFRYNNIHITDRLINVFQKIYKDNFFLEIQRLPKKEMNLDNYLISRSLNKNIPLVATNENFFLKKKFYSSHDALLSISEQKYIDSEDRLKSSPEYFFKNESEMLEIFSDIPSACWNTEMVARKCTFYLDEKPTILPKVYSSKLEEDNFLKQQSEEGLLNRLKGNNSNQSQISSYKKRLDYELEVITRMGYSGYFLIVSDFISWAKKNNIPVGPGRGSGAGSLVAWSLSITDLDPIKFGLIFERFLNPERVSLPDFDIDFCMEKRDEVISYVRKKYGVLNVAQIITFGSFQARAAIRDVGRVMQLPLNLVDDICKIIPYNPAQPVSLSETLRDEKIKRLMKNDPNIKKLFKISIDLEGLYRHVSTHAAGIVISDNSLLNLLPLYKDPKSDIPVTQFSMKYVEKIGLIKFDFLGLKTLTVINKACEYLNDAGKKIDINELPLDNSKTFDLLKKGDTTGVFQLEGQGMKETLKKILPDRFEDIIAVVSLYRPGPMDNIPTYINRKQGKESYDYSHPSLKEILSETHGIMVYQEQVMLIAQKLAGFSLAKADLLRRAMGKKIRSEMQAQKSNFVKGCLKNKIPEKNAETLFNEIEKFAGYGFNKSHAAAYAKIAYQTAFLKANFPLEFFCSLMNYDIGNFEKISNYCYEIKRLNFQLFTPDINKSDVFFKVIYNQNKKAVGISYGLSAIKNIGENSVIELLEERKKNGPFNSLLDLLKRVNNKILNKKVLEGLIFSGSLNSIEKNQNFLLKNIDKIISFNSSHHKNFLKDQANLFSDYIDQKQFDSSNFKKCKLEEKLTMEFESFGFYLSDHPSKFYKTLNNDKEVINIKNINDFDFDSNFSNQSFNVICLISELNERTSKAGRKYCFLNLSDETGSLDVICFSEVLESSHKYLQIGNVIFAKLVFQKFKESNRLVVSSINPLNDSNNKLKYLISLDPYNLNYQKLKILLDENNNGNCEFFFKISHSNHEIRITSKNKFNVNMDFLIALKNTKGVLDIKETN